MGLLITSTALFQNSIDVKFVVKLRDEWWVMRSWDSKVMLWSEDSDECILEKCLHIKCVLDEDDEVIYQIQIVMQWETTKMPNMQ